MRGVFTAGCIAHLEHLLDVRLSDHVELLVGTSTGGIIALGLAAGRSGEEMLEFYRQHGQTIFSNPRRLRRATGPKYDREALDTGLREEFGETTVLNELRVPVCIVAHELVAGTTRVLKDDHHGELAGGADRLVWKVAAATSAAPTYFAPVQIGQADSHIDGGIWANNPAMVGITEAVRYGGARLEDVRLVSIGTTSHVFRVASHDAAKRMGALAWIRRGRELLLGGGVSMATHMQAKLLLGDERYLRIDDQLATQYALDDWKSALALQELGEQQARLCRSRVAQLLGFG